MCESMCDEVLIVYHTHTHTLTGTKVSPQSVLRIRNQRDHLRKARGQRSNLKRVTLLKLLENCPAS